MSSAHYGSNSCSMSRQDEDLVLQAIMWQLPLDEVSSIDLASDDSLQPPAMTRGTVADECTTLECHESSPHSSPFASLFKPSASENESKPARPFQSLMLPEWIYEKAAEDEALGIFQVKELLSLNDSPTNSSVCSLASSRSSSPYCSPVVPTKDERDTRRMQRSVNWEDLTDSQEDETLSEGFVFFTPTPPTKSPHAGSEMSSLENTPIIATSSVRAPRVRKGRDWADLTDSDEECPCQCSLYRTSSTNSTASTCASSTMSSPLGSPNSPVKGRMHMPRVRRSGVNWADLPESDEEQGF